MPILAFHDNAPGIFTGLNNYSPKRFLQLMQFIVDMEYKIVNLFDYVEASDRKDLIALTFDDGYESFYRNIFPILLERDIAATVFIPSNFIGKSNSWDYSGRIFPTNHLTKYQLEELANNKITIGSHGLFHQCLTSLGERLLNLELIKSKEIIQDIIGKRISFISYPFGRFNAYVESVAIKAGYRHGFSLIQLTRGKSAFTLPRHAIYAFDTEYSVFQKIKSGPLKRLERFKSVIMNNYASGTIALNRFRKFN